MICYKWYFNKYSQYDVLDEAEDWLYCRKKRNFNVDFVNNFFDNYYATDKGTLKMTKDLFLTCPFLDRIFKNYTIECVILGGSCLYGITDNASDYDLDVFIKEPIEGIKDNDDTECVFYKGRKLHWYYNNVNNVINDDAHNTLYKAELCFLTKDNVLYGDAGGLMQLAAINKFKGIDDFIFANYAAIDLFCNRKDPVKVFVNAKIAAYLILFYFVITHEQIDKALIGQVKRSKYIRLSENGKNKATAALKWLKNYCRGKLGC